MAVISSMPSLWVLVGSSSVGVKKEMVPLSSPLVQPHHVVHVQQWAPAAGE